MGQKPLQILESVLVILFKKIKKIVPKPRGQKSNSEKSIQHFFLFIIIFHVNK